MLSKDERTWGMLCHLAGLSGHVIPFGGIIGPLIVWLIKKDELPFVNDQGREAVNFQLTMLIYEVVSAILIFVCIGIFLLFALMLFELIVIIMAAISANDGKAYRYPLTIQFVK